MEERKDTISRQDALDALRTCYETETITMNNGNEYINYDDAVYEIEQLPFVQPEIIRCRDCIAYHEGVDINGKPFTKCNGINGSVRTYGHTPPDWYCADAERRADG